MLNGTGIQFSQGAFVLHQDVVVLIELLAERLFGQRVVLWLYGPPFLFLPFQLFGPADLASSRIFIPVDDIEGRLIQLRLGSDTSLLLEVDWRDLQKRVALKDVALARQSAVSQLLLRVIEDFGLDPGRRLGSQLAVVAAELLHELRDGSRILRRVERLGGCWLDCSLLTWQSQLSQVRTIIIRVLNGQLILLTTHSCLRLLIQLSLVPSVFGRSR